MSTSKIRFEKANQFPKLTDCEDDLIFNLSTGYLHYRKEGVKSWKRLEPLGTANAPQGAEPGEWYMSKDTVYICHEKSTAYSFSKEVWVDKGIPLPGDVKVQTTNKSAVPLESLKLLEDSVKKTSNVEGALESIVFDGVNGILTYKPLRSPSWYHIKCFTTVTMRGMSTTPGHYVVAGDTVYIRGVDTMFFMDLSEFQEVLAGVSEDLFIPETNKTTVQLERLVRNSSAVKPSDVHVYDTETGHSYYIQNVLHIYKPDCISNEVVVTTEGIVALPKGFKVTLSYMNTQVERLLKEVPDACLTDTVGEEVKPRSIISQDIMTPITQIPKQDQQPDSGLLKSILDRLTALEARVSEMDLHDETQSTVVPDILSEASSGESDNGAAHEKEEKLSDQLARKRTIIDDRSDRYVRMVQFIELLEENPRAPVKALRVKMGLTVHIITDLLSKLRACGALTNKGHKMAPNWVVYREKFFEANPVDEYIY